MNIVEINRKFPTEAHCIEYLESVRWNGKPACPYCKAERITSMLKEHRHHCNNCNTTFSVTVNTIFHHTHLPLQKWFLAISVVLNAEKGIAARQLCINLEVNKNTAWSISKRIQQAMLESNQRKLLQVIAAIDETHVAEQGSHN